MPQSLLSSFVGVRTVGLMEQEEESPLTKPDLNRDAAGRYRLTVVDDSDAFVSLIAEVVADRFVVTGITPRGLDEIAKTAPHLLMVDLNPRRRGLLSGWQLIEEARAHPELQDIPIILCTGTVEANDELEHALRHPAVHMLTKPFALDVLDDTLSRAMAWSSGRHDDGNRPD